ncbi:MAG TPA: 50S ribosomal protein L21 [Candidatus Dojkabacteria bacterium]|nr:50S ribosomal protein L21 [Candidatus Dojkabacteria bacterium]HOT61104.1 50S ribosomal protein L21 [Candidatus Dojkabacteria bacterium]HQI92738.1 50S ribosomal protein L21 [Candidatus Dojkabacteria bacterium]
MAEIEKEIKKTPKNVTKRVVKEETKKVSKDKFAVIAISGVQLKVYEGKEYEINKLVGNKGDKIEISEVLLIADGEDIKIGNPYIEGSKVSLEISSQKKGEKINGLKYKAKSRYRKHFGSRPLITKVLVKKIG